MCVSVDRRTIFVAIEVAVTTTTSSGTVKFTAFAAFSLLCLQVSSDSLHPLELIACCRSLTHQLQSWFKPFTNTGENIMELLSLASLTLIAIVRCAGFAVTVATFKLLCCFCAGVNWTSATVFWFIPSAGVGGCLHPRWGCFQCWCCSAAILPGILLFCWLLRVRIARLIQRLRGKPVPQTEGSMSSLEMQSPSALLLLPRAEMSALDSKTIAIAALPSLILLQAKDEPSPTTTPSATGLASADAAASSVAAPAVAAIAGASAESGNGALREHEHEQTSPTRS